MAGKRKAGTPPRPAIGLAMIVKNAEDTIAETLESVRDLIGTWTIIDTGSTDATREIIAGVLGDIPGRLLDAPWSNFAYNRTELMEAAKGTADYLMLLDADMIVHLPAPLPPLEADVYEGFILTNDIAYALPILVRGDRDWEYRGVAHSYLAAVDNGPVETVQVRTLLIQDRSNTGEEKLRRDLEVLSAEHARNPLDSRTAFYLAQTYGNLDMVDEAIQAYRTRANMAGWDEETYIARMRLGALLCGHVSFLQGSAELIRAWEERPSRAEALRVLAMAAMSVADKIPMTPDRLFVRPADYKEPS